MKYYLFLLLFLLSNNLFCQDNFQELDFLFPGDSIPSNTFMLDEVTVYQPLTFENDDEFITDNYGTAVGVINPDKKFKVVIEG